MSNVPTHEMVSDVIQGARDHLSNWRYAFGGLSAFAATLVGAMFKFWTPRTGPGRSTCRPIARGGYWFGMSLIIASAGLFGLGGIKAIGWGATLDEIVARNVSSPARTIVEVRIFMDNISPYWRLYVAVFLGLSGTLSVWLCSKARSAEGKGEE